MEFSIYGNTKILNLNKVKFINKKRLSYKKNQANHIVWKINGRHANQNGANSGGRGDGGVGVWVGERERKRKPWDGEPTDSGRTKDG